MTARTQQYHNKKKTRSSLHTTLFHYFTKTPVVVILHIVHQPSWGVFSWRTCKLKSSTLWKRYVDEILEKIKTRHTQELTDHLNTAESTGNIQSAHEEEINRTISFLDMNIHHREDGSIKISLQKTHTHGPPLDSRTSHSYKKKSLLMGQHHHWGGGQTGERKTHTTCTNTLTDLLVNEHYLKFVSVITFTSPLLFLDFNLPYFIVFFSTLFF